MADASPPAPNDAQPQAEHAPVGAEQQLMAVNEGESGAEGATADAPVVLDDENEAREPGSDAKDETSQEVGAEEDDDVVEVEGPDESSRRKEQALERELQCALCCDLLFKPMSVSCGHSFCRVCLMRALHSRPIDEAQCPTCRAPMLTAPPSSILSINVTLWNVIQMMLPSHRRIRRTDANEEEEEYAVQIDQADAKWRIHSLTRRADEFHNEDEEQSDHVDSEDEGEEAEARRQRRIYPEIKVETVVDGRLTLSRNVIIDTTDHNEDGYASMRVALALVEFPSVLELYNEHQECSLAVVKLEEDEEMADGGAPFFLDENGDDDSLVLPNYYNEITLQVHDESGNCVMERTRGATRGTVTFPNLRLDVPGGTYTFSFKDDLYGVELSVTTELREPHEEHDAPLPEYISLVNDEAGDGSRRGRRRRYQDEEDEEEDDGDHSDDSFIVDDEEEESGAVAAFSDDGAEGEGVWEYSTDDEEHDENRERRRVERNRRKRERRRQRREQQRRVVELVDDGEEEEHEHDEHEPVIPRRNQRRNANQIVDSEDEHHDEDHKEEVEDEGEDKHQENDGGNLETRQTKVKRSDREEDEGEEEDQGEDDSVQRPLKRARPVFASDDSEQDDHPNEDGDEYERRVEHVEEDFQDEDGEVPHDVTDYGEDHEDDEGQFSDDNDGRVVHADGDDDFEEIDPREGQIYNEDDYEEEHGVHQDEIEDEFPDEPDEYMEDDQYDEYRGDEDEFYEE